MESIVIPNNVLKINRGVFSGCESLSSVKLARGAWYTDGENVVEDDLSDKSVAAEYLKKGNMITRQ